MPRWPTSRQQGAPIVVKADGLAAGKGVIVAMTEEQAIAAVDDIMLDKVFGAAGASVVIEEFMDGEEASFFAFTDGRNILPLASSQDHKRVFDNDEGPNTGGMGAYSPAPVVTAALHDEIVETIVKPTIDGMASEGCPYSGILYVGLMIKDGKPRVVEYNARFGDPEAQPLLMRMKSDIVPVLQACARGNLQQDCHRMARQGRGLRGHGLRRLPGGLRQGLRDHAGWTRCWRWTM